MLNLALLEQRSQRFSECFAWCDKALRCALHIPNTTDKVRVEMLLHLGNVLLLSTGAAFAKVLPLARFDTRRTFCSKRTSELLCMGFMMGACRAMRREEEDHPKALYRRGTAHALLGNFEEAARDLARSSLPASSRVQRRLMEVLVCSRLTRSCKPPARDLAWVLKCDKLSWL